MRRYALSLTPLFVIVIASNLCAKPATPVPDTALDGGVVSAESLGRGRTMASNIASPAAGSENPAALAESLISAAYTTVLLNTSSSLGTDVAERAEPLNGKTLQYLSIQGDKGVIYYEPLARRNETNILNPASPSTDYQELEYSANAIGFAGAQRWGNGSFGMSVAYLWSSIGSVEHTAAAPTKYVTDTADGVRLNLGVRYPTGPVMWGLLAQNIPGMLWGKDYKRLMAPVSLRAGNTWRATGGLFFSLDYERRFYAEGSNAEDLVYFGSEIYLSKLVVLRAGVFGPDIYKSEERHVTGGLSLTAKTGLRLTYAIESYELNTEKVKRSLLSVQMPFEASEDSGSSR